MKAVTFAQAKRDLEQIAEQVIADAEPTIVVMEKGAHMVLVSLDEYESWPETLRMLWNPENPEV